MTCDHIAFVLLDPSNDMFFSEREKTALEMLGVTSFSPCNVFKTLRLVGVHFTAGEWGRKRCGSVVTTIYRQVSRYCFVNAFLQLEGKVYASVTWLSTPTYPCAPFKLVVKVRMLTPQQQRSHRSVIPVDRIDPCTVPVLPHNDGVHFYMMWDKGTDRTTTVWFVIIDLACPNLIFSVYYFF